MLFGKRKQVVKLKDMWLDVGAKSREEAAALVRVGDPVVLELGYQEMRNGLANSPGMDNKTGLWVCIEAARRAKAKKLRPEEMANGTFSISNLGMYGIDQFAAVINPPEGAILAVGQMRTEPVVRGELVMPGRRIGMTLSCDHRVVDGALGAELLAAFKGCVEQPVTMLV